MFVCTYQYGVTNLRVTAERFQNMKPDNWKKISEILPDCLELNVSERRKYLDELHLSPELNSELEFFLAFENEAEDFMSETATGVTKDFFSPLEFDENPTVGQRIGVYKIEKEIGFGGMGAVYLATRADGKFEQKAAIKLLKREFNVEKIRQSFRREKEILARLAHPNIARLLDAGTTADGIPYLVMEYVEGVPIDKFCQQNNVPLKARLKLFNRVCEAVSFAHRNLIVHRDLKPSNILVNDAGEPKLLDFGISKLLDAENTEDKHTTLLGAMTPEYASPEQIKGEPVTTASDIYSLGVVLFKILTGSYPYNFKNKTNGNLLKEITDSEPFRPSDAADAAHNKSIPKSQIPNPKSLAGDLDNIILKALSKEPERRYQTVERFSDDLWRHIDGLPVLARSATFSYQARKFYGRHKISVLAGAFVFVSLLTGLTVALWQASVARGQARIATDARQHAELETMRAVSEEDKTRAEKEKAEKISRFMLKVLSYANPHWYAEGAKFNGETKVIEVMDELSDKIDVEFANQPDVQSELHHKFAEVYNSHSRNGRAEETSARILYHARRAVELRKQYYGERHELVAKDMFYLYVSDGVEKNDRANHLAEAIQIMRETNPHNLNLPYMLEAYAAYLMMPGQEAKHEEYRQAARPSTDENKYQIAERYLLEALPVFREHYKEDNQAIYLNECRLAYARLKQNKVAEAAPHLEICRAAATKFQNENQLNPIRKDLSIVEEAAAETNR